MNRRALPELKVLIVDVGLSDDFGELFPFLQKSPKLERLKLHRCTFSDEQMAQILDALPALKVLEIKPAGNTPGKRWSHRSLGLVARHPNIEILRLIHEDSLPLPWENGLEPLVAAKNLRVLMFPTKGKHTVNPDDLARLEAARPDLQINPSVELDVLLPSIVPYDWSIGPR